MVGRASDSTIVVPATHETVSRHHAEFGYQDGTWYVRELETLNGTFVNGLQLDRGGFAPLSSGSTVVLGDLTRGASIAVLVGPPQLHTPPSAISGPLPTAGLTVSHHSLKLVQAMVQGPDASRVVDTFRPASSAPITIGRRPDNDVVIHDPLVSGYHARLTPVDAGRFRVEDLNSTNGTFVNGVPVKSTVIGVGDILNVESLFLEVTASGLERVGQARGPSPSKSAEQGSPALAVAGVTFSVSTRSGDSSKARASTKTLLDNVSFALPERSLLAVIGPSGAGKSTMLKAMTGKIRTNRGQVFFRGLDMAVFAKSLSHQIGVVPQDDLVHVDLTAREALNYAAQLRFPDDSTKSERDAAVAWAMKELGLSSHADTQIKRMSGGQRKRVSTAMELLTRPELLFLDEPTSGLDPNLDREVMELLRDLAHGTPENPVGRTVVVITHSSLNLDKADNVLLLAPGGKVSFFGPPADLIPFFKDRLRHGDTSYASIYELLVRDPDQARDYFERSPLYHAPDSVSPPQSRATGSTDHVKANLVRQSWTLLSRQLKLTVADRSLLLFTLALPVVMGLLTLAVQAQNGFNPATATKSVGNPRVLLVVLAFGAVLMGMVPSIRQLVGERAIFRREAGVGVRPSAYLGSKLLLLGLINLIQSIVLVAVALALNPHPARGVLWTLSLELTVVVFAIAWASSALGLLLSGLAGTSEQVMPLMVVVLMLQLILCGGVIGVTGPVVNQVSWLTTSRWGFAAGASSLDFNVSITCNLQRLTAQKQDEEANKRSREATDKLNKEAADQAKAKGLPAPSPKAPDVVSTKVDCDSLEDRDPLWTANVTTWVGDIAMVLATFTFACGATYLSLRRVRD